MRKEIRTIAHNGGSSSKGRNTGSTTDSKTIFTFCLIFAFLFAVVGGAYAAETLRLITWSGYTPKTLLDKFEKETGIKVMPTNSSNEEMIAKLRATRGAGFDLAQPSQDRISSVQAKYSIYQPIDFSKIKADQFVPSMLDAVKKNTMVGGKAQGWLFLKPAGSGAGSELVAVKVQNGAGQLGGLAGKSFTVTKAPMAGNAGQWLCLKPAGGTAACRRR